MFDPEIKNVNGVIPLQAADTGVKNVDVEPQGKVKFESSSEDDSVELSEDFEEDITIDGDTPAVSADDTAQKLESLTRDELVELSNNTADELEEYKTKYADAMSGNTPELLALKDAETEAYQVYTAAVKVVNVDMAEHLVSLKEDESQKEIEFNQAVIAVNEGELEVSNKQNVCDAAVLSRRTTEGKLGGLYSQLYSTENEELKASLNSQIATVKNQVEKIRQIEAAALEELNEARDNLEQLKQSKDEKEQSFEDAKIAVSDFEAEINAAHPKLEELYNKYEDAKNEYINAKEEAVNTAKAELDDKQNYLNEVNAALLKAEIEEALKEVPEEETEETKDTYKDSTFQDPTYVNYPVSGGYSSGGSYPAGGSYSSGTSGANNAFNTNSTSEKEPTTEDLEAANVKTQEKLSDFEKAAKGETQELSALKQEKEDNYNTLFENLSSRDAVKANDLSELKAQIDKREEEVAQKQNEVAAQEIVVEAAKSKYENLVALRTALQTTCDELEEYIKNAKDEDTSEIKAKLQTLKEEISKTKDLEKEAKEELDAEKEILSGLKDEENELITGEGGLNELNEAMKTLCLELAEDYPELKDDVTAYINSADKFSSEKQSALEAARAELIEAAQNASSISKTLNEAEIKKTTAEYSPNKGYNAEFGEHLIDTARKMLGIYGETKGLCAGGVRRTFEMACGIQMSGNGCDWINNMDKLVEQGYFVKVDRSEYPTSADLVNLPAGAVVAWENTGADSPAGKYGHVCIADGEGGEISDHYEPVIYRSVGGRNDTYHIYLPVRSP